MIRSVPPAYGGDIALYHVWAGDIVEKIEQHRTDFDQVAIAVNHRMVEPGPNAAESRSLALIALFIPGAR